MHAVTLPNCVADPPRQVAKTAPAAASARELVVGEILETRGPRFAALESGCDRAVRCAARSPRKDPPLDRAQRARVVDVVPPVEASQSGELCDVRFTTVEATGNLGHVDT